MTAAELVSEVRARGGHVFRIIEPPQVFVLTRDEELARWLRGMGGSEFGNYLLSPGGVREWDIRIHRVGVEDADESGHAVWNAAA